MKLINPTLAALAASCMSAAAGAQVILEYVSSIDTGNAEIVAFDPATQSLLSTNGGNVDVIDFRDPTNMALLRTIDLSALFESGENVSSVAADPLGRGYGAAAVMPANPAVEFNDLSAQTPGKLAIFDIASGEVLVTLDVGYHPDSVIFTKDGALIIVTNEGEVKLAGQTQAPGSVSVIAFDIADSDGVSALTQDAVSTYDFTTANLGDGVSIEGLRRNHESPELYFDIEPEYSAYVNGKIYTTLQENNAVAALDVASGQYTSIFRLGTIEQRVDASDRDNPSNSSGIILIDDVLHGMPLPDTIGAYEVDSVPYFVTANEGDAHIDDADITRINGFGSGSIPPLDPAYRAELDARYPDLANGAFNDKALGRLEVSFIDGDLDGDGDIDRIHMLGTRSFTIWNGLTGEIVFDSGSFFEEYIRDNDPASWDDGRSDSKGPEPEGLVLFEIEGRIYVVIAMERTDGLFLFDISNPAEPEFQSYISTAVGNGFGDAPEGLAYAAVNGRHYVMVASEGQGDITVFELKMDARHLRLGLPLRWCLQRLGLDREPGGVRVHRHRRRLRQLALRPQVRVKKRFR